MADMLKQGVKFGFGVCVVASFIAYTVEFAQDQSRTKIFWIISISSAHRGQIGFILLWIFILLFAIVGIIACLMENSLVAGVFFICYSVCVLCDGLYVAYDFAWIMGVIASSLGCAFCVSCAGGGGGGGGK
ncbi:hypothetical protein BLOT_008589 [Blomia tropicalis]|nr:hypothetical protein BLOT_008589 [Blomia tropicalis]